MQSENFTKFILMNKNLTTPDPSKLKFQENKVTIKETYFGQGDYIAVNSVRINDMFYGDG